MIRVADSPKNRDFDLVSGRFTPIRPTDQRRERKGPTYFLAPGKPGRPLFDSAAPRVSRRNQRVQVVPRPFPAGYCLTPTADSRRAKTERGPISRSGPFLLVWPQTGDPYGKISVFPRSPPVNRRPYTRGRRHSTPVAPGLPGGWP